MIKKTYEKPEVIIEEFLLENASGGLCTAVLSGLDIPDFPPDPDII